MRILQILEATLGGTARHVIDLTTGLRQREHEVHLIYNPRVARVDAIFSAGLETMKAAGVQLVPLDMSRSVGLRDVSVMRAIRRYAKAHGPFDVIHGHSSKGGAYARIAGLALPAVRVYTPHAFVTTNPELNGAARLAYTVMERLLAVLTDRLVAVSGEERSEAQRLGIRDDRISVVPNGTDTWPARFLSRADLAIPDEALVIGTVGRLVPQKATAMLLRAFALLAPRYPALRLAVVGTGPLAEALQREVTLPERVHWLGALDGPAVMPAFDIFALPSAYEGFAYVLIEAARAGLPIVTTSVGGASLIVEEGRNGFVTAPGRQDSFAAALERLIDSSDLRRAMGERSVVVAKRFTAGAMVDGVLDAYRASLPR